MEQKPCTFISAYNYCLTIFYSCKFGVMLTIIVSLRANKIRWCVHLISISDEPKSCLCVRQLQYNSCCARDAKAEGARPCDLSLLFSVAGAKFWVRPIYWLCFFFFAFSCVTFFSFGAAATAARADYTRVIVTRQSRANFGDTTQTKLRDNCACCVFCYLRYIIRRLRKMIRSHGRLVINQIKGFENKLVK
jgi:hypothetical protein